MPGSVTGLTMPAMYEWSLYLCLLALLMVGWFLNLLGLPGLWLMVAAAVGYAWATGWALLSWPGLLPY